MWGCLRTDSLGQNAADFGDESLSDTPPLTGSDAAGRQLLLAHRRRPATCRDRDVPGRGRRQAAGRRARIQPPAA
jgi:hypothetical protein